MFVNDFKNDFATEAMQVALKYIQSNPDLGISVQLTSVDGNQTESRPLLENCKYEAAFINNSSMILHNLINALIRIRKNW